MPPAATEHTPGKGFHWRVVLRPASRVGVIGHFVAAQCRLWPHFNDCRYRPPLQTANFCGLGNIPAGPAQRRGPSARPRESINVV